MKNDEALQLLVDGNRRWVEDRPDRPNQGSRRRAEVATAQAPFAAIFSCVDSRVPPELVFDRGIGDLFVIRTAAHVLDAAALGSIVFGIEELRIPLVVVMGHQRCGAVSAAVAAAGSDVQPSGSVRALVEAIRPSVTRAVGEASQLVDSAVRAHVERTVGILRASPEVEPAIRRDAVAIVGAYYELERGNVEVTVP